jgi:hypothetical protein
MMSEIDFDMAMERRADRNGDRVKITMSGRFLSFKYYDATGVAKQQHNNEEDDDNNSHAAHHPNHVMHHDFSSSSPL